MFGKNRTAPVPARGKHSLSLKPEKASEPITEDKEEPIKVIKGPDKWFNNSASATDKTTSNKTKQPNIRIEFNEATDTLKVFIDGVEQEKVQHINLTWYKPDMEDEYVRSRYRIEMADEQGRLHGIGQGK